MKLYLLEFTRSKSRAASTAGWRVTTLKVNDQKAFTYVGGDQDTKGIVTGFWIAHKYKDQLLRMVDADSTLMAHFGVTTHKDSIHLDGGVGYQVMKNLLKLMNVTVVDVSDRTALAVQQEHDEDLTIAPFNQKGTPT